MHAEEHQQDSNKRQVRAHLGLLVITPLPVQTDTSAERDTLNTTGPDELVQLRVDANLRRQKRHTLLGLPAQQVCSSQTRHQ